MKRICYTLNLKNKKSLIREYINHHNNVWPEIIKNMKDSGIINAEIYNFSNRLFFLIEVDETFSEKRKKDLDKKNKFVSKWEEMMLKYQELIPNSPRGQKWVKMNKIFEL
tara:strand:+ start:2561 stop:2890 length:330 start_codon:yes stop_codon:yes gene_type:complete